MTRVPGARTGANAPFDAHQSSASTGPGRVGSVGWTRIGPGGESMQRPSLRTGGLLATAALVMAVGGAPLLVSGADHLDAPALGHTSSGSTVDLVSTHGDRDINDVYVFNNAARTRTVFAMTTNPAVNVPTIDDMANFGTNVRYVINVDRTGDAVQDLAYVSR